MGVCMQGAMRRCGHNPTDIEVSDIINKIHNDTGSLDFEVGTESFKQGWLYLLHYIKDSGRKVQSIHALGFFIQSLR